jgi:hypothetical protein
MVVAFIGSPECVPDLQKGLGNERPAHRGMVCRRCLTLHVVLLRRFSRSLERLFVRHGRREDLNLRLQNETCCWQMPRRGDWHSPQTRYSGYCGVNSSRTTEAAPGQSHTQEGRSQPRSFQETAQELLATLTQFGVSDAVEGAFPGLNRDSRIFLFYDSG